LATDTTDRKPHNLCRTRYLEKA